MFATKKSQSRRFNSKVIHLEPGANIVYLWGAADRQPFAQNSLHPYLKCKMIGSLMTTKFCEKEYLTQLPSPCPNNEMKGCM